MSVSSCTRPITAITAVATAMAECLWPGRPEIIITTYAARDKNAQHSHSYYTANSEKMSLCNILTECGLSYYIGSPLLVSGLQPTFRLRSIEYEL